MDVNQDTMSKEQVLHMLVSSANCKAVVVLIHGTWAREAEWTRRGDLVAALALELRGPIFLAHFDWSGRNDHPSRLEAARQLSTYLSEIRRLRSDFRIILLAHSHGGNVALYALREDVSIADAVVTLATPFLLVEPRNLRSYKKSFAISARGWAFALLLVFCSWFSAIAF